MSLRPPGILGLMTAVLLSRVVCSARRALSHHQPFTIIVTSAVLRRYVHGRTRRGDTSDAGGPRSMSCRVHSGRQCRQREALLNSANERRRHGRRPDQATRRAPDDENDPNARPAQERLYLSCRDSSISSCRRPRRRLGIRFGDSTLRARPLMSQPVVFRNESCLVVRFLIRFRQGQAICGRGASIDPTMGIRCSSR